MAFKTRESLDTNIILRLMLNDIPEQRKKALMLLQRPNITYYIPDLAITEAVHVLQGYSKTRAEIISYLKNLLTPLNIEADFNLFHQAFSLYLEHPQLSFNDCYLSAKAAADEAEPLWTFDRDLAKKSPTAKLLA